MQKVKCQSAGVSAVRTPQVINMVKLDPWYYYWAVCMAVKSVLEY